MLATSISGRLPRGNGLICTSAHLRAAAHWTRSDVVGVSALATEVNGFSRLRLIPITHSVGSVKDSSYIGRLAEPWRIASFAMALSLFLPVFLLVRLVAAGRFIFNFDSPKLASKYIHT